MLKYVIFMYIQLFIPFAHCITQCPVNYVNSCSNDYCFCPNDYNKVIYNKCTYCLPFCDQYNCSLRYCICDEGYIKTNIDNCYKCILNLS